MNILRGARFTYNFMTTQNFIQGQVSQYLQDFQVHKWIRYRSGYLSQAKCDKQWLLALAVDIYIESCCAQLYFVAPFLPC